MRADDKKSGNKILVSNPGKQYVHQLLFALERNNFNYRFFTSFWYKPGKFPFNFISFLPKKAAEKLKREFRKRYYEKLNDKFISQLPYWEIIREISDKLFGQKYAETMQFYRDRLHDRWVAWRLNNSYSTMIGYEESCVQSFRKAKEKGIITVLDLSQVHYRTIDSISQKYPVFNQMYSNKKLRDKINKIKQEELELADYVICLSDFAKGTLVDQGFNAQKIFTAYLGFDPYKFQPKKNYSLTGKLKIVFAGTLTRRKGLDLLLEASLQLSEKVDLTLIGPMADAGDLLNSYQGKYEWQPYVDQEELNILLNQSDLFVFPSYLDSWAMVVIEAMACGLPVIVSENTGAKEAVVNNSGFIIPAGNTDILKEKINYFYTNRSELKTMGENARTASLAYTWENYYETMNNIILKIQNYHEKGRK
jgi:glycosyltransferase involved in cell wall biosynthesis